MRELLLTIAAACIFAVSPSAAAANALLAAALSSITNEELYEHVQVLADDVYEGRGGGTRGGHAAGQYLVRQLREYPLEPAGTDGSYFQPFQNGGRNILVLLPGNDPQLSQEVIVVGAHYDHVGRGNKGSGFGPIGEIHNGADDNASGVSVLLETIEALASTRLTSRRTILFAFWDSEEIGLLGSKHWLRQPTLPREHVKLAIHADMVGRLRNGRLSVLGTRSGYGLRQLASGPVDDPLWLDFTWELSANSDHWSFLEHRIPIALLHTGLHDDYHRPSDDVERINAEGMREVSQYLLALIIKAGNADELPKFRAEAKRENGATQRRVELPLRPLRLDDWPAHLPTPRLGISWRSTEAEPGAVFLTQVVAGTPAAAAGLAVLDRITDINGKPFATENEFRSMIMDLVAGSTPEFTLGIESRGRVRTATVRIPSNETASE